MTPTTKEHPVGRPAPDEHDRYYDRYVSLVEGDDAIAVLETQVDELRALLAGVTGELERHRYEPGKWSFREVVGHLADAERVFGHRAFCIARGDTQPLPGYDQEAYAVLAAFDTRPLASLLDELAALRAGNLAVWRALDDAGWRRVGNANGAPVSVRALAFMTAGHVRHHVAVLRAKYGVGAA